MVDGRLFEKGEWRGGLASGKVLLRATPLTRLARVVVLVLLGYLGFLQVLEFLGFLGFFGVSAAVRFAEETVLQQVSASASASTSISAIRGSGAGSNYAQYYTKYMLPLLLYSECTLEYIDREEDMYLPPDGPMNRWRKTKKTRNDSHFGHCSPTPSYSLQYQHQYPTCTCMQCMYSRD